MILSVVQLYLVLLSLLKDTSKGCQEMPESSGDEEEEGRKKAIEEKKKKIESSDESEEESEEEVEEKKVVIAKASPKKEESEEEESEEEESEEDNEIEVTKQVVRNVEKEQSKEAGDGKKVQSKDDEEEESEEDEDESEEQGGEGTVSSLVKEEIKKEAVVKKVEDEEDEAIDNPDILKGLEMPAKRVTFDVDEKPQEVALFGEIVAGSPVKMIKLAHLMTSGKLEEMAPKGEELALAEVFLAMESSRGDGDGLKADDEVVQLSAESPSVLAQDQGDGRKSPKVPPKTYMWEDVRRSKVKGGYPWTHLYKGSMDEETWKSIIEHEYEPISPMPEKARSRSPMIIRQEPAEEVRERKFIRIPDSDQIIIPLHGSSDEEYNPDRYQDKGLICQEEVGKVPAFRPSPSPVPPSPREAEAKISERLRSTATNISSKIRKISLPDKSKIRLPEKPKFLSEKPKFLTEKPKFLTEKPKFLTEKPKFLTEKPKFLTERPKFLTEKPKFLKDRPKFKLPDAGRFKIDRSKVHMPNIRFPKKRAAGTQEAHVSTVTSEFGSEKNIFETLKAKTYPRFLNKKKKGKRPPVKKFDSESLPSTPRSKRNEQWVECYKGRGDEKAHSAERASETFHERYTKREAKRASSSSLNSDREVASSGSSTQRHRAGVIEEIDSDEFFVRVKGISREDVDVSRYLSSEIREAFRSPQNALASLDLEDDEEIVKAPKEYPRQEFNTFPLRPSRTKSSPRPGAEKPPRRFRSKIKEKQGSLPSLEGAAVDIPPLPPKRRKSNRDLTPVEWNQDSNVPNQKMAHNEDVKVVYDVPVAPVRKARSHGTSLGDEDGTSRGAESLRSELHDELEGQVYRPEEEEPISRETVKYQEEMSHGYDLVEDVIPKRPARSSSREKAEYATVTKIRPTRPPPPKRQLQRQFHTWKNQGVNFFWTYPRRAIKSLNRPPHSPKRPTRNYSTIAGPSRPPRRSKVFREPVYADESMNDVPYIDEGDLGRDKFIDGIERMKGRPLPPPPRPPRKTKDFDTLEKTSYTTEEMNILNDLDSKEIELSVDLDDGISETVAATLMTSYEEDVKIKSQPAPKRPSRKSSFSSQKENLSSRTAEISQQTSFDVTEITVSVQTDPLPEGFIVQDTEPSKVEHEEEPSIEKYLQKYGKEIKMLERQITKTAERSPVVERRSNLEESEKKREAENKMTSENKETIKKEYTEEKIVNRETPKADESKADVKESKAKIELSASERLHLSTLDVDNLNVSSLKASQILVSDLSGQSLQVAELTSRGGNLVVSGLQLPQDFIQSLASEIQARVESSSPQPQKKTLVAAPPPIVVQTTAEVVSPPTPETSSAGDSLPRPKTTRSRGRKSPTRIIDDSEDELASIMPSRVESESKKDKKEEPSTSSAPVSQGSSEPSATKLLIQLINIWRGYMVEGFFSCYNTVNTLFPEGDKRRDAQTAAVILFILILGLIALGFGVDNTVHHHHWDFVPPRN